MKILAVLILIQGLFAQSLFTGSLAGAQTLFPPTPVPIPASLPTKASAFTKKTASSTADTAPTDASTLSPPTLQNEMHITPEDVNSANLLISLQTQGKKSSVSEAMGQIYGSLHTEIEKEITTEATQLQMDKDQYVKSPQSYANFIRTMTTTDLNKLGPLNRGIALFKIEFRRNIQNSVISNDDRRMKNENVMVRNYIRPWVNQMGLTDSPFFQDYKE